jgi:hypothetical protein
MKTVLASAVLVGGLVMAGTANAATPYECELYAQNVAEQQYPTGGGALVGGVVGGVGGGLLAGALGGKPGVGAGVGAVGGVAVGSAAYQANKKKAHDLAYASCLSSATPAAIGPVPVVFPPVPFNATIKGSALNVRGGPGTNYPVLWQLTAGMVFVVNGCNVGWCVMNQNGAVGYVSQSYVFPLAGG